MTGPLEGKEHSSTNDRIKALEAKVTGLQAGLTDLRSKEAAKSVAFYNRYGSVVLRAMMDDYLIRLTTVTESFTAPESSAATRRSLDISVDSPKLASPSPSKRQKTKHPADPVYLARPIEPVLTGETEASRKARAYIALRDALLPPSLSSITKSKVWVSFQRIANMGSRAAHTGFSREVVFKSANFAQEDGRYNEEDKALILVAAEYVLEVKLESFCDQPAAFRGSILNFHSTSVVDSDEHFLHNEFYLATLALPS